MSEHNRRANVARVENVLDRKRIRLVPRNQLGNSVVDLAEPKRQRILRFRAQNPALEQNRRRRTRILSHHTIPRDRGTGIDAENDHAVLPVLPSIVVPRESAAEFPTSDGREGVPLEGAFKARDLSRPARIEREASGGRRCVQPGLARARVAPERGAPTSPALARNS